MFVGSCLRPARALERSENAFDRLVRSLTRTGLVGEKILLAALCSFVVTLLMLLGLGLFIPLEWDRFPLWLLGLIVAAVAFGAMGTAIGALHERSRWHRCWLLLCSCRLRFSHWFHRVS